MTRIDLKDAYLVITIHQQYHRFLRFHWEDQDYEFVCLPFGLASAPRVFTKVMRTVVTFLRNRGIRCVIYLDDLLLMNKSPSTLKEHTTLTLDLLEALGFLVNYPKSHLTPSQEMEYLGFLIDSTQKELRLPKAKLDQIRTEASQILTSKETSARHLAQLIGKMSAAILAIYPAPLHYRSLQALKHKALARCGYDGHITLSEEAKVDLRWWTNNLTQWNGQTMSQLPPQCTIETDASSVGWGAFCQGEATGGCWSVEEKGLHINELELLAVSLALKSFLKREGVRSVMIKSDSMTVVAHINKLGGTRSPRLVALTKEIFTWCMERNMSSTPPREGEHHSRLPVKTPQRQDRLDSESEYIPRDQQDLGATGGGSLRHMLLNPTASILQLESRSGGHSDRRLCPGVENTSRICTPSMVPHLKSVNEDPDGGGYNRTNHSSLAISAMVPGIAEHDSGCPNSPPRDSRPALSITELRLPSARVPATPGRLESIRENLRARRIPENASRLIISSWRDKTNTNYNSAWRKWDAWCAKRGLSSFTADVSAILSFLADEFEAGRQYRSLNCYRSALSSTLLPVEGILVGQHPLVIRLLKGVFNLRPPMPRYTHTWDVSKVLTLLKEMGPNENLNLKRLTQKLVMLLALVLGQRCSDLVRLSLSGHSYTSDSVVLPCLGLAKQAKPNNEQCLQPVVIKSFKDKLLCPVACIRAYESSTSKLRTDGVWKLFLAVIPPHQPLTSLSIARWIKKSLKEAGIDECFTAHSTRTASATAAAMSGISTKEIMSRAGWSSEHTFTKFYYRPKAMVGQYYKHAKKHVD